MGYDAYLINSKCLLKGSYWRCPSQIIKKQLQCFSSFCFSTKTMVSRLTAYLQFVPIVFPQFATTFAAILVVEELNHRARLWCFLLLCTIYLPLLGAFFIICNISIITFFICQFSVFCEHDFFVQLFLYVIHKPVVAGQFVRHILNKHYKKLT